MENSIEKFVEAIFIMTPKRCPKCQKLITDEEELIMMHHTNECASCDSAYLEDLEERKSVQP